MDIQIALFIHNLFPWNGWVHSFFEGVSYLGTATAISAIVIMGTIFLLFRGRLHKAHIMLLAGISSGIVSNVMKFIVKRPRPLLWGGVDLPFTHSFPSGHALVSTVVYGIIARFFAEHYPEKKWYFYSIAGILAFLIGLSRIYLGVHWPSDVLGGWSIGLLLLAGLYWWNEKGGIVRAIRWIFGFVAIMFGFIGLILPIIPGIPLLIGGFLLIFSDRSVMDLITFKKKTANQQ